MNPVPAPAKPLAAVPRPAWPEGLTPLSDPEGLVSLPALFLLNAPASAIRVATALARLSQSDRGQPWTVQRWDSQESLRKVAGLGRSSFAEGLDYCLTGDPAAGVPPIVVKSREVVYEGGRSLLVYSLRFNLGPDGRLRASGGRPGPRPGSGGPGPRPGPGMGDASPDVHPTGRAPDPEPNRDACTPSSGKARAIAPGKPDTPPIAVRKGEFEHPSGTCNRASAIPPDSESGPEAEAAIVAAHLAELPESERAAVQAEALRRSVAKLGRKVGSGPAWVQAEALAILRARDPGKYAALECARAAAQASPAVGGGARSLDRTYPSPLARRVATLGPGAEAGAIESLAAATADALRDYESLDFHRKFLRAAAEGSADLRGRLAGAFQEALHMQAGRAAAPWRLRHKGLAAPRAYFGSAAAKILRGAAAPRP